MNLNWDAGLCSLWELNYKVDSSVNKLVPLHTDSRIDHLVPKCVSSGLHRKATYFFNFSFLNDYRHKRRCETVHRDP